MRAFVLDNSVTMRWCFENGDNPYADGVLQRLGAGDQAIVPILWLYEVVSVLTKAQRVGVIAPDKADAFVDALQSLGIVIDDHGQDRVLSEVRDLARAHRLTGYDAVYLELALRRGLRLATLDADLVRACRAAGGVVL